LGQRVSGYVERQLPLTLPPTTGKDKNLESLASAPSRVNAPLNIGWSRRIPELDGFRAIAVWMVFLAHLVAGWPVPDGALNGVPHSLLYVILHGWHGVDLFFVLSGLLITGILLDARNKPHYFRNFYLRRALRIVPVYFTVIAVCFFFYPGYAKYFALSCVFLSNFSYAFGVFLPHGPEVFWSLSIEEHFYLLWPVIVSLTNRRTLAWICLAIVCLTPGLRALAFASGLDPELQIYKYSFFRFDGLAYGALLAIWLRSPRCNVRSALRLAGVLFGVLALISAAGVPLGILGSKTLIGSALHYSQASLLFAGMMLVAVVLRGSRYTAILRSAPMRVSADLSYCIYLIHLSVGDAYQWALLRSGIDLVAIAGARGAFLTQCVCIVGATFLLAAISKKYLENPVLRLRKFFEAPGHV
jgi:peptidoglycan/LPS O-acetylase OafA/YrhL